MDTLKAMQLFARVVEQGSFSKVATQAGLTQPTVSKAIAGLERDLSTQLLKRSTREVRPTDVGQRYYLECRRVLEAAAQAQASIEGARSRPSGVLKVSVPVSFGSLYVVPRIVDFLERNPQLQVDLSMNSHRVDLIREGYDLAIQTGRLAASTLIARRIGFNHRAMVATPAYLDAAGRPARPEDLQRHNCILGLDPWELQGPRGAIRVQAHGNLRLNHAEGVRDAVLLGLGIGVLPLWATHAQIAAGTLEVVLPGFAPVPKDVHAVYPYTRVPAPKIRAFIAFLERDLRRVNASLPARAGRRAGARS